MYPQQNPYNTYPGICFFSSSYQEGYSNPMGMGLATNPGMNTNPMANPGYYPPGTMSNPYPGTMSNPYPGPGMATNPGRSGLTAYNPAYPAMNNLGMGLATNPGVNMNPMASNPGMNPSLGMGYMTNPMASNPGMNLGMGLATNPGMMGVGMNPSPLASNPRNMPSMGPGMATNPMCCSNPMASNPMGMGTNPMGTNPNPMGMGMNTNPRPATGMIPTMGANHANPNPMGAGMNTNLGGTNTSAASSGIGSMNSSGSSSIPGMPTSTPQSGASSIPGMPTSAPQSGASPASAPQSGASSIPGMPTSAPQSGASSIPGMPTSSPQSSAPSTSNTTTTNSHTAAPTTKSVPTTTASPSEDLDATKIQIIVSNPHFVEDEDGSRTEYDVTLKSELHCHGIKGTPITLNKRFNDFEVLYQKLIEAMEERANLIPEFPSKGWFTNKYDEEVIKERMQKFQQIMNFVCKEKILREHFYLDQFFDIPRMREIINNNRGK